MWGGNTCPKGFGNDKENKRVLEVINVFIFVKPFLIIPSTNSPKPLLSRLFYFRLRSNVVSEVA